MELSAVEMMRFLYAKNEPERWYFRYRNQLK